MTGVVPVALIAFRRADLLTRTLAGLRANRVPLIYAFSDGPRGDADAEGVAAVRRALRSVDWAEVRLVERPVNIGLDASLIGGISETLAAHPEVVVCEDDIEMAPGTYAYMLAALDRYRDEQRVMCVSGWTHPRTTPADAMDAPHFTGRFGGWGWATWRRAWAGFPGHSAADLYAQCGAHGVDAGRHGQDIVDWAVRHGAAAPWDIAFSLHMMLHDGLTLTPARAMTAHIGVDQRATHAQDAPEWSASPEAPPPLDSIRWPEVRENPAAAGLWRDAVRPPPSPSLLRRVMRRLNKSLRRPS